MKNKTLFIGCGGSGIKTLMRVNELLAGNPESRQVLLMMRNQIAALSYDGAVVQETDICEGSDSFLRIGNYLFLTDYGRIDRVTFRSQ